MKDLKTFEIITLSASLVIPILFFGFYPEPLMNSIETSVENTLNMYNFDLIKQPCIKRLMENFQYILPEIFISVSIMLFLLFGVFKKNSAS